MERITAVKKISIYLLFVATLLFSNVMFLQRVKADTLSTCDLGGSWSTDWLLNAKNALQSAYPNSFDWQSDTTDAVLMKPPAITGVYAYLYLYAGQIEIGHNGSNQTNFYQKNATPSGSYTGNTIYLYSIPLSSSGTLQFPVTRSTHDSAPPTEYQNMPNAPNIQICGTRNVTNKSGYTETYPITMPAYTGVLWGALCEYNSEIVATDPACVAPPPDLAPLTERDVFLISSAITVLISYLFIKQFVFRLESK